MTDPAYHTAQCNVCNFVAMHPYPSDQFLHDHYKSRELYNSGHDPSSYERAVSDRAALIAGLLRRAEVEHTTGTSIDFGAGVGIAVAAQRSLGFDAMGIETNPAAQKVGHEVFGVDIRDLTLSDMPGDLTLFTVFEVLEHIKYPREFMAAVRAKMAPNGVIAGSVPNYKGLARYLRGKASIALYWPEHVNQFTRETLADTLRGAGFEVVYIGFPSPYGIVMTIGLRTWLRKKLPAGSYLERLIKAVTWLKKYVAYPLPNLFAEKTGLLGHGLVFVAVNRTP
ncbi:class I SAM-dependent methyltransferase [Asticcacaulis sp. 201]|uniref:class I SAM-dependent methyltransferase n=1 Tax=Asticcacaulis sp. 201 TaxID=3028787 RepID=UPI0029169E73|nr:class I SAM-dependent methyltransferase [Asticcacaulis sp. 201]MDV6330639.1 class I SAM-dependent methyltransferase [Asticcacaulis sp. 201]